MNHALTVDVHSHVMPSGLPDLDGAHPFPRWPTLATEGDEGMILVGGKPFRAVDARCWSPPHRVADLDESKVDVQVVSPVPITFCHDAPPDGAVALARAQNDFLAGFVAAAPDRFAAFGAVPLQAPDEAAVELARCVGELGFAGVEIGTVAGDVELSDPKLDGFWAAAAEHGATVFVHPGALPCAARLAPLDLAFGVGMPCETATAAAGLIVGGVLDRHPGVQILLAHGGGALPWLLPRLDQGWVIQPRQRDLIPELPSHYARRFLVDTLTYDAAALWLAVERFGADHVLLGTDSPFAAREDPPGAALDACVQTGLLNGADAARIAGGNATELLRVPLPSGRRGDS